MTTEKGGRGTAPPPNSLQSQAGLPPGPEMCALCSAHSLQSNSISDTGVAALMAALCTNQTLLSLK